MEKWNPSNFKTIMYSHILYSVVVKQQNILFILPLRSVHSVNNYFYVICLLLFMYLYTYNFICICAYDKYILLFLEKKIRHFRESIGHTRLLHSD